jgi:hypothetical protein
MKKIFLVIISILVIKNFSHAQAINWVALQKEDRHIININAALDYGTTFGAGYAYQLRTKLPILLNMEHSFPAGKDALDDFKTKFGGQIRLITTGNVIVSAKLQGIFRRYENSLVRLINFGSDMSGTIGFYKRRWFATGEVGFDKAIITHFKNSDLAKQNFPGIKDGWYEPASGGNFYYGLQAGYSFRQMDIYLKAGNIITQDFKTKPLLPLYAQLGWNIKIN